MRLAIGMSGLLVAFSLIVMIHCAIVSTHIRDAEVTTGLESAADYALDQMQEMCADMNFANMDRALAEKQIMESFCQALQLMIGTDGEIEVYVSRLDLDTGSFDFIVEERYEYSFRGRKGLTRCERAVCFYD